MLLINLVMVKFAEKDLFRAKLQTGRVILGMLKQRVAKEAVGKRKDLVALGSDPLLKTEISQLVKTGGFGRVLMVDSVSSKVFSSGSWDKKEHEALSLSRVALATREESFHFSGTTWGVIWLGKKRLNMAAPFFNEGRLLGVLAIGVDLDPLYAMLRKSEKIIVIYIFLNSIVLILVGFHLLSRTVVKPIHKLLHIAEAFKGGEPFPHLSDTSRNEIGQLNRALNMMLTRLEEKEEELKAHIASLEEANQTIKEAQAEIIKSEKLASVGRLATGVAHEIGNPIGIIQGYLELLKGGAVGREEDQDFLDRIEVETSRISLIIRQLLDFSRPASGVVVQTGVHDLIIETTNMLKPQPMMAHIEIEHLLGAAEDTVWADPNQIEQVFVNIIMNSSDAMSDRENSDDRRPKVLTIKTANKGDSLEVKFIDTGPGIQEEDLIHVFDPFYTTKEPGKGTGLGLAVCHRIIEGLGGAIRAESVHGKGTAIIVDIPLYSDERGE